ncbi:MAG: hypothetical protein HY304_00095 [candidate division Zixibacteria bacterium]|nr:hypothetical protein [candidate division Zixibacteria bacterium]
MNPSLRRLARSGGLVAAAFALKYPLVAIPGLEPLTLVFFALGYAYGPIWGALVGATGEVVYATLNPLGVAVVPVWMAQIIGMAGAGVAGGATRFLADHLAHRDGRLPAILAGVLATLFFDAVTNLAYALSIGPFWPVLLAGLPFAAVHVASNALLFLTIFPTLRRWLMRPAHAVVEPSAT